MVENIFIVHFRNGVDVRHQSIPKSDLKSYIEKYCKGEDISILSPTEYYKKFENKEFQTG